MSFKPTEVISALEDLQKETVKTFHIYHPAMAEVIERGQMRHAEAPEVTFVITPDGPGFIRAMPSGDEEIPVGLRENSVKGRETSGMATYSYTVTEDMIARLGGKQDIVQLLKDFPVNALDSFKQSMARQFVMGDVPDLYTMPTLNPEASYQPNSSVAARNGLLALGAPNTQGGTLHGITRNAVPNYHNQYGEITSFRTDGTFVFRSVMLRAAQQGYTEAGPDIALCDDATLLNYLRFNDEKTIFVDKPGTDKNTKTAHRKGALLMENGVRLIADPFINTANFVDARLQSGVAYCLDLATLEFFTHSGSWDGVNVKHGWFESRPVRELERQLAWLSVTTLRFGALLKNPRTNAVITGGARE